MSASASMHMMRSGSQASDGTRSVESVGSPTTAGTTYTPETTRFKGKAVSRSFGIPSDASPSNPTDSFDIAALRHVVSGLSATANSFTPTGSKQSAQLLPPTSNSKLAQLTATSTPDDNFTSTPRATGQMSGMAQPSLIQWSTYDPSHKIMPKAKMPAFQLEPDATRYVIVAPYDVGTASFILGFLNGIFEGAISMKSKTLNGTGSLTVFRFDSIREASVAVVTARYRLHTGSPFQAKVSFIDGHMYKQFDPSLDDPTEGTIMIGVSASTGLDIRSVAIDEASRFGFIHSSEITDEVSGYIRIKITYDSVKAANDAFQEWAGFKHSLKYSGVSLHAWRSSTTPVTDMKQVRSDSVLYPGNGVKLHFGNSAAGAVPSAAAVINTTNANPRTSAAASLKHTGPIFGQPGLNYTSPWTGSSAPVNPPGLGNPRRPYHSTVEHTGPKNTRSARNSNPVDTQKIIEGLDIRTTIMLRNIPNKMTAAELKQIIDRTSFGRYDFSYLRIDFANQCNVGYAFINFTKPEYIIDFLREHNGRPWGLYNSDKIAEVSYATRQGLASLIDLFQNSCVMEEIPEHRPKLWYTEADGIMCGQEKLFPSPTNLQKLQRSRDMAATVGLYPPRGNRGFHHDDRFRMSQYDRGTPQALRDAQLNGMLHAGMGYAPLTPGYPTYGGPMPFPYGYPGAAPFYPPYHL